MENITVGFIGADNMANCLIRGLLAEGLGHSSIIAADVDDGKLQALNSECGIRIADNQSIADEANVIVLAVKPQMMESVCRGIVLNSDSGLVVSVAAGITVNLLRKWLGDNIAIVRCMPNTPALVGKGATGLYANEIVSSAQRIVAKSLMDSVGISVWVDNEIDIDTVTAVSGSGPAYFFLFMEAMQETASELGLSEDVAQRIVYQTALGAAKLAIESEDTTSELRHKVTSPGGTTEQAIETFEKNGLKAIVRRALIAAKKRSIELAESSNT